MAQELFTSVVGDGFVQVSLVAPLRHPDLHLRTAQMLEPLFVCAYIFRQAWHQHLFGNTGGRLVAVQRFKDAVDQPAGRQIFHLVEDETLAAHHPALAYEEHLHGRLEIVVGDAHHVEVFTALGNHLLFGHGALHRCQPVAQARRLLELEFLGSGAHLGIESVHDVVGVAVEELAQFSHELAIRHVVDLADTRPAALLDVEQQTGPAEALMLVELARAARAHREAPQQQVERFANGVGVCIWPEVPSALALATAHHQRPREGFVERHRQERVALVVTQANVEPRPELLDEAVLEHERLDLVTHLDPFHRLCGGHHLRGSGVQLPGVLEVVREALTQARGLAHVDDGAKTILMQVHSRLVREGTELAADGFGDWHGRNFN